MLSSCRDEPFAAGRRMLCRLRAASREARASTPHSGAFDDPPSGCFRSGPFRIFSHAGVPLPVEIGNIAKVLINLRAICLKLAPNFNTDSAIQRHLEELSRDRDESIVMFPERLTSAI